MNSWKSVIGDLKCDFGKGVDHYRDEMTAWIIRQNTAKLTIKKYTF